MELFKKSENKSEVVTARITPTQKDKLNKIIELYAEDGVDKTVADIVNESLEMYFKRKVIYSSDPVSKWKFTDKQHVEAFIPKHLEFINSDVLEVIDEDIRSLINGKHKNNQSKRNILMIGNEMLRTVRAMREYEEAKKDYYIKELTKQLNETEKQKLRNELSLKLEKSKGDKNE